MRTRVWDAAGASLSALCLIHCLILPIAAALLPFLGRLAEAEWVHWAFVGTAAPITALAFGPALRIKPAPRLASITAAAGLALLFCGAFDAPSRAWGERLTLMGSLCLCFAHILNWRRAHSHARTAAPDAPIQS